VILRMTSGAQLNFKFLMIITHPNFEIRNSDFLIFKIIQILQRDSLKHKEQLSFLTQLKLPSGLQVIHSGTNSKLNFP
jgi:hypothetical protein